MNSNDTAADGTVVVGLGIVVYYEGVPASTTVKVKNGITQYNHLSESQANDYITDSNAKTLTSVMFSNDYSSLQYNDGSDTWVNTGIISMISTVDGDNITGADGYTGMTASVTSSMNGYVYTKTPTASSIAAVATDYVTEGQYPIAPEYSLEYPEAEGDKNYVAKTDGSNDYCVLTDGIVTISMDSGDTFSWDTSILNVTKAGKDIDYTVTMNGTDYTGKNIDFSTAGSYTVTYTYTDDNNYGLDSNGNIVTYEKVYEKTVNITVDVVKAAWKSAEITVDTSKIASFSEYVMTGDYDYLFLKYTVRNVHILSATVMNMSISI